MVAMVFRFAMSARSWLIALPLGLSLAGCSSTANKASLVLLSRADSLSQQRLFAEALACVDEAITLAPADTAVLRQSTDRKRTIHLREAEYMLLVLDSQLREVDVSIEAKAQGFVIERNDAYDTPARYIAPALVPNKLGARPHLRLSVDDEGMKFVSVYAGKGSPHHSAMRLALAGVDSTYTTPEVPYDEALNYRYTDAASTRWELVTYSPEEALRIATYLHKGLEQGSALSVDLLSRGKAVQRLQLSQLERQALLESIELGELRAQRRELQRQQIIYAQRFARLSSQ